MFPIQIYQLGTLYRALVSKRSCTMPKVSFVDKHYRYFSKVKLKISFEAYFCSFRALVAHRSHKI